MFQIKIETNGILKEKDNNDESAIEAIETIYNLEDKVIFKWNDVNFIASLKYDISDSWRDIINLRRNLNGEQKEFSIQFPSQSFWHYWTSNEIEGDKWEIEAFWSNEKRKKIKVEKNLFESEFQRLIDKVESDLKSQGYDKFDFIEYQNVIKNIHDKILAWRKYPEPLGSNYYQHSLEKEFYVKVLLDSCQILEATIFKEGWNFLLSNYGLKGLYEIDKTSGWFNTSSTEEWLESILHQGLISGLNLQSKNYGTFYENSNIFKTSRGEIEKIDWKKFKAQKLT